MFVWVTINRQKILVSVFFLINTDAETIIILPKLVVLLLRSSALYSCDGAVNKGSVTEIVVTCWTSEEGGNSHFCLRYRTKIQFLNLLRLLYMYVRHRARGCIDADGSYLLSAKLSYRLYGDHSARLLFIRLFYDVISVTVVYVTSIEL